MSATPRQQPTGSCARPTRTDERRAAPRRRLLLHVCCAPCASHAVELLCRDHQVTLFFSNSNIAPQAEYRRRASAAADLARIYRCDLIEDDYDHAAWLAAVRGLESEPEKGRRCLGCFEFNLRRTAAAAQARGFDGFTTTLTTSPHKRSADILAIGSRLPGFVAVDFKKKDGFRHSLELSRRHNLFRQDYCGCEFSRRVQADTSAV